MMKIWERYFYRETLKVLFLFLFCFWGLYVLIDYSSHSSSQNYHHSLLGWSDLLLYYLCELTQRLDVLLPFAILLATIRTLCNLSIHNELVAIRASGMNIKTLLRPFIIIGLAGTAFLYLNNEIFIPKALLKAHHISDQKTEKRKKRDDSLRVHSLALKDDSTLLYQNYDTENGFFFDAYWVRSLDEIYRIKYLYPEKIPRGVFVDQLSRDGAGSLVQVDSFEEMNFSNLRFNKRALQDTITPIEEYSLSALKKKIPADRSSLSEKQATITTTYYKKLALPWICVIAVIGIAPFCVRFSRNFPVFFIYAFGIFGLIGFYLVLDSSAVLGKRQVIDPAIAIWTPFLTLATPLFLRFLLFRG